MLYIKAKNLSISKDISNFFIVNYYKRKDFESNLKKMQIHNIREIIYKFTFKLIFLCIFIFTLFLIHT